MSGVWSSVWWLSHSETATYQIASLLAEGWTTSGEPTRNDCVHASTAAGRADREHDQEVLQANR